MYTAFGVTVWFRFITNIKLSPKKENRKMKKGSLKTNASKNKRRSNFLKLLLLFRLLK